MDCLEKSGLLHALSVCKVPLASLKPHNALRSELLINAGNSMSHGNPFLLLGGGGGRFSKVHLQSNGFILLGKRERKRFV